jgi:hypothetical protein
MPLVRENERQRMETYLLRGDQFHDDQKVEVR